MSLRRRFLGLAVGLSLLFGHVSGFGQKIKLWDGNRTTPVHLIPLFDENNEPIIPTEANPFPFSARMTCGPCHDYDTIRGGWHFNGPTAEQNGRPGEPWFWSDPRTGTVLPLSHRDWPGSWDPKEVGLAAWDFTRLFGRHMPGGGTAEPEEDEDRVSPESRWNVSGKAEVNCLACHNGSGRQDHSEWTKQVLRENLRWAATAAGGVGEVGGMASRLRSTWDVYDGPDPDDRQWAVAPFVKYRTVDFDSKHRYLFDLDYAPEDDGCLACHSVSPVGAAKFRTEADVHTAAGIKCVSCHRNGLDHGMIRGYEGEAEETAESLADSLTCRGCHIGEDPDGNRLPAPGRLGAPYPRHRGIPLVHFKRLSCTVCHSGPMPTDEYTRVRTSRANRLGIYGIAQWWTDAPKIIEPVYVRDERGKVTPNRLVWPAFWAKLDGKNVIPLRPEIIESVATEILDAETRIARVLAALLEVCEEGETAVVLSGRHRFDVNIDGGVDATAMESAPDQEGPLWGFEKNGDISPLIPEFDPADEERDPAIEVRIDQILGALGRVARAPGKPVFFMKGTLYQIRDGYFDISDAPEEMEETSGWAWLAEDSLLPLAAEYDIRTVVAKAGREQTLTEEQVMLVLNALADSTEEPGQGAAVAYGYISGGRLFRLNGRSGLSARNHPATRPVTWPLAHTVRPAQQSLGRTGCTDCHSAGSDFFFSTVNGAGPLLTSRVEKISANSLMGLGGIFQSLFGLSFTARPLFKVLLIVCSVVIGSLLLLVFVLSLGRLAGFIEKGGRP